MNSEPILETGAILPVAVVTTFTDISEKKLAAEELRARQHEMEEAQRLARVGSWRWKVAGDKVQWSRELYRIVGLDPANEAPPFAEQARYYTVESWSTLTAAVGQALRTGEPYETELELIRVDGTHLAAPADVPLEC